MLKTLSFASIVSTSNRMHFRCAAQSPIKLINISNSNANSCAREPHVHSNASTSDVRVQEREVAYNEPQLSIDSSDNELTI